jgi:hypothetical protein
MASKLKNTIGRALRGPAQHTTDPVHFHLASDGRAFVCDIAACDSAALTLGELQLVTTYAS